MFEPVQENPYPDTDVLGAGAEPHPQLKPVLDLLGRWRGTGRGEYPTLAEGFRYVQEVSFSHDGRPFLRYESRAWLVDGEGVPLRPSGRESGWWRVLPDASLEVVLAHPTGIVETYTGRVAEPAGGAAGTGIELATDRVAVTPRAKEVTGMRRRYALQDGVLAVTQEMAAMGLPYHHHLAAELHRLGG
ncbi:FABP family protein [Streptomyces bambusae]|uniref:FABP family protein n=1 Tax=Streptomyces bambusae TaxID=1550616 RepID=UPI001CFD20AD|nr:FABP family protein [Streptomyces bambusae]MCB5167715.1 FABP family protein [Streptomyces bambusae]